jgi:hypothetical protein
MKVYGDWLYGDPNFIDLSTTWGLVVSFTPLPVWTTWRSDNSRPYRDSKSDPLICTISLSIDCAIPALSGSV